MDIFIKLKKRRTTRRIIEIAIVVVAFAFLIIFCILKENSKVVTSVDAEPFLSYDYVEYKEDYAAAILVSGLFFAVSLSFLIADLLAAKIYYTEIDGEDIIVYNGLGLARLFVNDEEKDSMFLKSYLETRLKSGVVLTIVPQFFMSYRITFSDDRPAIDL